MTHAQSHQQSLFHVWFTNPSRLKLRDRTGDSLPFLFQSSQGKTGRAEGQPAVLSATADISAASDPLPDVRILEAQAVGHHAD